MRIETVEPAGTRRYRARSVVSVQRHADGSVTRVLLADDGDQPKVSKRARRLDRGVRKLVRAENVITSEYLRRHQASNSRKDDGAVRDLPRNLRRSVRKGLKTL